jgi:hypothetical protein
MNFNLKKMKTMLFLLLIININSCTKFMCREDDDELSIESMDYTGNQLRIDGYYYIIANDGSVYDSYFFYNTGIIMDLSGVATNVEEMDNRLTNLIKNKEYDYPKFTFGVFLIKDNSITIERWYPSECPYKAFVKSGQIINDTTFVINKMYRMQNGKKTEIRELDQTYHFRQFSPKPDSTNNFIK